MSEGLPVLIHWHIGIFVELHRVARKDVTCRSLIADRHAFLVSQPRHLTIEVVGKEFVDGASPVGKELARLFAAVYYPSEDSRHPGEEIVAATTLELLSHVSCPSLRRAFPAVHQHIVYQSLQRSVGKSSYVTAELIGNESRVELVHFPARSLLRRRSVALPRIHMPDAQDNPCSLWSSPAKFSVARHLVCQVDDISSFDETASILVHILGKLQQSARSPACLHLPIMPSGCCGET